MGTLFRERLLAVAEQAAFPAEKTLDPATGVERLDPQAHALMAELFGLFGVTTLSPDDEDFDKVVNTACTLATEVAAHVQELDASGGSLDALADAADWHPAYRAYVNALWQGDSEAVLRCAAQLRLAEGIPNGSLPLDAGPLA